MNKIIITLIASLLSISMAGQSVLITKIDSIFQPLKSDNAPGLSIGILKNGELIYNKGFGLANLEYGIQNSDTSIFDIASIAKQFTSSCVWTLINNGKISLDDDIRKYLPELPFYGDTIKIRNMLNHTSGLRNYPSLLDLAGIDYTKEFYNNQKILDLMCRQKGINNIPGEKVLYGNTPYNLLTIIIERITNQKFGDYAVEHLFKPLGMNNTYYRTDNVSIVKNRAVGYVKDKEKGFIQIPRIESCYGAGSLWSDVKDLVIWTNIFTRKSSVFNGLADFLEQQDTLNSGEPASYSRGVMVDNYKNKKTIHHSGMTMGYNSQIIVVPEIDLSVIILTNTQSIDPDELSYKILDIFIADVDKKPSKKVHYTHSKNELLSLTGTYQEVNSDLRMEVILENDTLKAKTNQGHDFIPLLSANKKIFMRINSESVRYFFDTKGRFTYDLIVYFGSNPFYFERITLIDPPKIIKSDYTGDYYSEELNVSYKIYVENDKLFLSYPGNQGIELVPGQKDEFGNRMRRRYTFIRDSNNNVSGIKVAAEGTVKDISFSKID